MGTAIGTVCFETQVLAVGEQVDAFREQGILVLFGEDAPEELHEFCAVHRPTAAPLRPVRAGDVIDIDGHHLLVTAVGDRAADNLERLGHVSLKASGEDVAPLPGDVCVAGQLPPVTPGSMVRITDAAGSDTAAGG